MLIHLELPWRQLFWSWHVQKLPLSQDQSLQQPSGLTVELSLPEKKRYVCCEEKQSFKKLGVLQEH